VTIVARNGDLLRKTAEEIGAHAARRVGFVVADITTAEGRSAALAACREPDILVNNAGGPPPGDFRDWDRAAWLRAIDANMLTPIELIKATIDTMIARKFGRIVNITSGTVKAPLVGLDLSSGARAGLTAFMAGVARSVAAANVTINFMQPGAFATERLNSNIDTNAKKRGIPFEQAKADRIASIPAKRFGVPEEFGATCAFLCSTHAAYITGQNLLLDGGAFPGAF